jgi:hypothetical protein
MRYVSTRGGGEPVNFSTALLRGIAPDGGLYVPEAWPRYEARPAPSALSNAAAEVISGFVEGDALAPHLFEITADALNFPAPLIALTRSCSNFSMGQRRRSKTLERGFWRRASPESNEAMIAYCTFWWRHLAIRAARSPPRFTIAPVHASACFIRGV